MDDPRTLDELTDRMATLAKDGVYLAVGLTVVTVQKVQEQASELRRLLDARLSAGKEQVEHLNARVEPQLKALDERIGTLESRLADLVDQLGDRLPEQAEQVLDKAFDAATSARAQLRDRWLGDAAA